MTQDHAENTKLSNGAQIKVIEKIFEERQEECFGRDANGICPSKMCGRCNFFGATDDGKI